jgi:SAM-dependent methyltransferase
MTDDMARMCKIGKGKKVLDIGSGKGTTACYLAQKYDCEIVGIDISERMIVYATDRAKKEGLEDKVSFKNANALKLPFEEESFDIVLTECTTTLLDKRKAFTEFLRVVKTGGYIADLEMTWLKLPPCELEKKIYDLWGGFTTMTLRKWIDFFIKMNISDVRAVDFSETILSMKRRMMRDLGFIGLFRLLYILLLHSEIRKAMKEYNEIFVNYKDYIGYGYVVGRKKGG